MDSKTVYLSPEQLQEQGLPPLTLCGGPLAPYLANPIQGPASVSALDCEPASHDSPHDGLSHLIPSEPLEFAASPTMTPESPAVQQPGKQPPQLSAKLAQMLIDATPEQRDQAARVAANLLAIRAKKRAPTQE